MCFLIAKKKDVWNKQTYVLILKEKRKKTLLLPYNG